MLIFLQIWRSREKRQTMSQIFEFLKHKDPTFFFQQSSRNRADLLLYESKPTDEREQYDWTVEKNWTGIS